MDMTIDQAGEDEFLAQIDDVGARRRIYEAGRNGGDAIALDQHALLLPRRFARVRKQRARVNDCGVGGIGCHRHFFWACINWARGGDFVIRTR
jgi:hypothetical protein